MKVLFCSPFLDSENVAKGGINTWGRYIVSFYNEQVSNDVTLVPISYDRKPKKSLGKTDIVSRFFRGIFEYYLPIKQTLYSIRHDDAQVIHLCTSGGLGFIRDYYILHVAKRKNIKTILHLHFGRIPEIIKQKHWEWRLFKKVLGVCDIPIVMNNPSEEALINAGYGNVKCLPNPLGLNALKNIAYYEGQFSREKRRILFCGHVIRTKGVLELVEACSKLSNINLRIIGKYSLDIKSEMESIALKVRDDISWMTFVGEVDHEEVIKEFYQSDIFVFPSHTEGFPNVILEAMACGCPIIASSVGPIPEMLNWQFSPCGICVPPHRPNELYEAIQSIINDNILKQRFSNMAKARVYELYTINKVWDKLINLWQV